MELKDTIEMMQSGDYRERFKAEVYQLKIRIDKLRVFVEEYAAGELEFTPSCPQEILQKQLDYMYSYYGVLMRRAEIENIELDI